MQGLSQPRRKHTNNYNVVPAQAEEIWIEKVIGVVPAHAGVILMNNKLHLKMPSSPRTRRGDPIAAACSCSSSE